LAETLRGFPPCGPAELLWARRPAVRPRTVWIGAPATAEASGDRDGRAPPIPLPRNHLNAVPANLNNVGAKLKIAALNLHEAPVNRKIVPGNQNIVPAKLKIASANRNEAPLN
jgi:hypothetical protein